MKNGQMNVALLITGGGTTMREILRACKDGRMPHVNPRLIIASRPDAAGIEKAKAEGMDEKDIVVIRRKGKELPEFLEFGEAIIKACRERGVDFIGQYGWLPLTPPNVIEAFKGMIVNQHPGPLDPGRPDFGGEGMYGRRVHCARLYFVRTLNVDYPTTEVVAHRVYEEFDKGPVLHRAVVPISKHDDPSSLQERALPVEHRIQIETLQMFCEGTVRELVRERPLLPDEAVPVLNMAKHIGITLYPKG